MRHSTQHTLTCRALAVPWKLVVGQCPSAAPPSASRRTRPLPSKRRRALGNARPPRTSLPRATPPPARGPRRRKSAERSRRVPPNRKDFLAATLPVLPGPTFIARIDSANNLSSHFASIKSTEGQFLRQHRVLRRARETTCSTRARPACRVLALFRLGQNRSPSELILAGARMLLLLLLLLVWCGVVWRLAFVVVAVSSPLFPLVRCY